MKWLRWTDIYFHGRNPTLEEQALGRIYRIGQDKEVTTVRFFIRDSFEEVPGSSFYSFSAELSRNPTKIPD
jgi:hypothetical protein